MATFGTRSRLAQNVPRSLALTDLGAGRRTLASLMCVTRRPSVAPPERLEHPDARGGLLDVGGEDVLLVLDAAGQDPVAAFEAQAQRGDGGECRRGDQAEQRVHAA